MAHIIFRQAPLGGPLPTTDESIIQDINSNYNNIFPDMDLTLHNKQTDYVDYTVVYIQNNAKQKSDNFVQPEVFINQEGQRAKYKIAILPKNEHAQVLPSQRVEPTDVVFYTTNSEKTLKIQGNDEFSQSLEKGEFCAIYIKRILEKGSMEGVSSTAEDFFELFTRGYE